MEAAAPTTGTTTFSVLLVICCYVVSFYSTSIPDLEGEVAEYDMGPWDIDVMHLEARLWV